MEISSTILYIVAVVVAFIWAAKLIQKGRYSLFQFLCWLILFFCTVAKIRKDFFPLFLKPNGAPPELLIRFFWVPFSGYIPLMNAGQNIWLQLAFAVAISFAMAFCLCILTDSVKLWRILLLTVALSYGIEILSLFSVLLLKNALIYSDTGTLLCNMLGAVAGWGFYRLFRSFWEKQKKRGGADEGEFAG